MRMVLLMDRGLLSESNADDADCSSGGLMSEDLGKLRPYGLFGRLAQ